MTYIRVCENEYPLKEIDKRKIPGFPMDRFLAENIAPLAKKILEDFHFVIIVSGNGQVRVGKSVIAQQIGAYLTNEVNKYWNLNNTWSGKNIVFKADKLIDKSKNEFGKGAVLQLDEGDDLTEHYYSHLAMTLKRYFRKCGQLNQILILCIPDYFELPRMYAITRSICLINVKFGGELERGWASFYDFQKKKSLYILGKKMLDYSVVDPNFRFNFENFYTIDEKEYRELKKKDFEDDDQTTQIKPNGMRSSKFTSPETLLKTIEFLNKHNISMKEFCDYQKFNYDSFKGQLSTWRNHIEDAIEKEDT